MNYEIGEDQETFTNSWAYFGLDLGPFEVQIES